jgi:biotin carboxyl carrier protein
MATSPVSRRVVVSDTPATRHDGDVPVVVEAPAGTYRDPIPRGRRAHVGTPTLADARGIHTTEVVVDGWRFEFEVEDADRAELRARAARDRAGLSGGGGPLEIRAIIPGRIASVAVVAGDAVEAGQTLLAVEAMKMQNELRAPRAGSVGRVAVAAGATVELGDLLLVLE